MANSCVWDPATNAFKLILVPPTKPRGTSGSASLNISATFTTAEVTNRVFSSYQGPPANGVGAGYSFWQVGPEGGGPVGASIWNIQGPAFGSPAKEIYIQPTYNTPVGPVGPAHQYTNAPAQNGDNYTFNDPVGEGSSSITVTMVEPG